MRIALHCHSKYSHDNYFELEALMAEAPRKGLDAIETHNDLNLEKENQKAIRVARERNLPFIGCSGCHGCSQVERAYTEFDNPVRSMKDLVTEILSGHCRGRLQEQAKQVA